MRDSSSCESSYSLRVLRCRRRPTRLLRELNIADPTTLQLTLASRLLYAVQEGLETHHTALVTATDALPGTKQTLERVLNKAPYYGSPLSTNMTRLVFVFLPLNFLHTRSLL